MKKNQENQLSNESVQMMDENSRTLRQTQHLAAGKGVEMPIEGPDVIATRTRAALKRNALGDLSNIQSAQVSITLLSCPLSLDRVSCYLIFG